MKYQKKNTFDNLNNVEAEQITHLSSHQQHISINDENYPQWLVDFLINNNAYITTDRNNNLALILPDLNQAMHVNDYFVAIEQDNDYFVIPMSQYQFETLYEAKRSPFENQFIQELTNALKEDQNKNGNKAFHINLDPTDIFNKLNLNSLADLVNNKDVQSLLHSLGIEIETNNDSSENDEDEKPADGIKPFTKDDFNDDWKNDIEKLLKQPIGEDIDDNKKDNPFNSFSKNLADIFNDNFTNSYKKNTKPKSKVVDSQVAKPTTTKSNNENANTSKPSAEATHSDTSNSATLATNSEVAKIAKPTKHKKPALHIPARNELSQVKDKFDNKDLVKIAMTCSSRAQLAKIIGYDSSTVSHWVRNTKHEEIKKHFN